MLRWSLGLAVMLAAAQAFAHPPPPPPELATDDARPTLIEWTSWVRCGFVVSHSDGTSATPRTLQPISMPEDDRTLGGAVGAGFTLPLGSRMRAGAWIEARGWSLPVVGGEMTVIPGSLDLFFYRGQSAITLRAGGNPDVRTAQLNLSYRAPWDLFGSRPRSSRYMIGAGLVATVTQNRHDPHDWSALVGLELEPLGAIRYLLGIRSWY